MSLAFKLRALTAENFGRLLAAVFAAVQVYCTYRFSPYRIWFFLIAFRLCNLRMLFLMIVVVMDVVPTGARCENSGCH